MRWQWLWLAATAATAAPVVHWHSAPVRPGQVVAVVGGGWSDNPRVELAPLPRGLHGPPGRGQAVTLLAHDDANLQFELPAGEVDLWEARIDGQPTFVANLPELWWAQAVPSTNGDQIALAGRFLPADGAVVELRTSQQTMRIPLALGRYQARFERPAALSGACRLRLHRGVGGER
ncbi:MAG: hypothetical protein HUU35_02385, partial [Armatimonadetes bacterium]|nr:hypothetical protein [Armatimonadota bacterium]